MLFVNPHPGTAKGMTVLQNEACSAVYIGKTPVASCNDNPSELPGSKPIASITRHPEFFFDNTLIAIQIENTLFNVHKYQLAKSGVFSKMFELPKPVDDEPEEGSSPEHPILIHGVAASDFAALLKVLYASHFSNQSGPETSLIVPAFRIANLFSFSELRAYLLPLAEKSLDDADKIVFAREFDIKEWLTPALVRLCKREEHLSAEEARKLEVDTVLIISRMREKHRSSRSTTIATRIYCGNCIGVEYYTTGGGCTCQHCNTTAHGLYLRSIGPGRMGTSNGVDESVLEAELRKWVEDGFGVKIE